MGNEKNLVDSFAKKIIVKVMWDSLYTDSQVGIDEKMRALLGGWLTEVHHKLEPCPRWRNLPTPLAVP